MTVEEVRVVKFGGSTTGTGARIGAAARRLIDSPAGSILAVASAPGDSTDETLRVLSDGGVPPEDPRALGPLWRAEQVGAELLASALRARGEEVRLLQPEGPDWPIVLRSASFGASVDLPETRLRFRRLWSKPRRPRITVMPGFIGIDRDGRPGTLARGGGDTTAVVAARCLGAPEVLLVKDVPGVLPADPRIVPGRRPLEAISAEELEVLCLGGAPVVAVESLRFLTRDLTIRVVGLDEPWGPVSGTLVRRSGVPREGRGFARGAGEPAPHPRYPASRSGPWTLVTALPTLRPDSPGANGGPPSLRADSWVTDVGRADELVRHLLTTGEYRAVASRPFHAEAPSVRPSVPGTGPAEPTAPSPSRRRRIAPPAAVR